MGETLSTISSWDDGDDGEEDENDNPVQYMDMERGDYQNVELREEEFYQMQHARMADRFGTPDIDPRFFYGNCIRLERYHCETGETTAFCWMPVDHVIAKMLLCNPHLHRGLLEDTLHDCPMIGCLLGDADQIVHMIMERFVHYGLIKGYTDMEDQHDTESPPSPTHQNDSDNGGDDDEQQQVFIPGFAAPKCPQKITILDPNNPPPTSLPTSQITIPESQQQGYAIVDGEKHSIGTTGSIEKETPQK